MIIAAYKNKKAYNLFPVIGYSFMNISYATHSTTKSTKFISEP